MDGIAKVIKVLIGFVLAVLAGFVVFSIIPNTNILPGFDDYMKRVVPGVFGGIAFWIIQKYWVEGK